MKKLLSTALALALIFTALVGCSPTTNKSSDNKSSGVTSGKPNENKNDEDTPASISQPDNNKTEYTTDGKVTKLVGDVNAKGELNISRFDINLYGETTLFSLAVEKYKELYPNVKLNVELKNYTTEEDMKAYWSNLRTATLAGDGPDLFWTNGMDVLKMANGGAFADLTEFFENDKNFNINDYNKNVFYGGQLEGKQYIVPTGYTLPNFLTTQEIIDEKLVDAEKFTDFNTTVTELKRIIEENNKTKKFLNPIKNMAHLLYFWNYAGLGYLDFEEQTAKVDSPEMKLALENQKELLATTGKNLGGIASDNGYYAPQTLSEKSTILLSNLSEQFYDTLDFSRRINALGLKPVVLPYRNVRGKITSVVNDAIAISNNSKNKQNAYNFIKVLISEEVQGYCEEKSKGTNSTRLGHVPVSNLALNKIYEKIKTDETLDYGQEYIVELKGLSQEFIDKFNEFISEIDSVQFNTKANDYFISEFEPFLQGQKSYEECAKSAQTKLDIFISE